MDPTSFPYTVPAAAKVYQDSDAAIRQACTQNNSDVSAFAKLHAALSKDGPLNVDRLLQIAEQQKIKVSRSEVVEIFKRYDVGGGISDGKIDLKEFAAWWSTAKDGLSVLLRNALSESILDPGVCEQWKRGHSLRVDATAGTVNDDFEAKSGIYVTAVPSSETLLREVCGIGADDRLPLATATTRLLVKRGATEDDIFELIDLANVAVDTMVREVFNGAKLFKADLKRVVDSSFGREERAIQVDLQLLALPKAGKQIEMRQMIDEVLSISGLKDQPLFRSVVLGIEFATDGSKVFETAPEKSLADLLEAVRVHANVEYDDAWLKIGSAVQLLFGRENEYAAVVFASMLGRGIRSTHLTANFRNFQEVLDRMMQMVLRMPFLPPTGADLKDEEALMKALEPGTGPQDAQDGPVSRHMRAASAQMLKERLDLAVLPTTIRASMVNFVLQKPLRRLFGEPPAYYIVDILGPASSREWKQKLLALLQATPNSGAFNNMTVNLRRKPTKPGSTRPSAYGVIVDNDGVMIPNQREYPSEQGPLGRVFLADYTTVETLARSALHFEQKVRFARNLAFSAMPAAEVDLKDVPIHEFVLFYSTATTAAANEAALGLDAAKEHFCRATGACRDLVESFDGKTLPARLGKYIFDCADDFPPPAYEFPDIAQVEKLLAGMKAFDLQGKSSSNDDDFPEVLRARLMESVCKTVGGLISVDATTEFASIDVTVKNMPFADAISFTTLEAMQRNQLEFEARWWVLNELMCNTEDYSEWLMLTRTYTKQQEDEKAAEIQSWLAQSPGVPVAAAAAAATDAAPAAPAAASSVRDDMSREVSVEIKPAAAPYVSEADRYDSNETD